MVRLVLRDPLAEGVKVADTLQLAPAARLLPQVLVCAKSPLFAPLITMLVMFRATVPVLLMVTFCVPLVVPTAWSGNVTDDGLTVTLGNDVPLPLSVTV